MYVNRSNGALRIEHASSVFSLSVQTSVLAVLLQYIYIYIYMYIYIYIYIDVQLTVHRDKFL